MSLQASDLETRLAHVPDGTPEWVDALNELAWETRALALSQEANALACSLAYPKGLAYSLLYEAKHAGRNQVRGGEA